MPVSRADGPGRRGSSSAQWRSAAACRSADPDLFFPISDGPAREQAAKATRRSACNCGFGANAWRSRYRQGEDHGIWGCTTEHERAAAAKDSQRAACDRRAAPSMTLPTRLSRPCRKRPLAGHPRADRRVCPVRGPLARPVSCISACSPECVRIRRWTSMARSPGWWPTSRRRRAAGPPGRQDVMRWCCGKSRSCATTSRVALLSSSVHSNVGTCLQILQHQIGRSATRPGRFPGIRAPAAQRGTPRPRALRAYWLAHVFLRLAPQGAGPAGR